MGMLPLRSISGLALLLGSLLGASVAFSANNSASFVVRVQLQQPGGPANVAAFTSAAASSCVSQSLSTEAGAQVSVLCSGSQVVQIEANTGGVYLAGVHGGAFRYLTLDRTHGGTAEHDIVPRALERAEWKQAIVSPALVSPMSLPQLSPDRSESKVVEMVVTF